MKIVKSFEDKDFFEKYHNDSERDISDDYKMKGQWYWRLGDDGNLYYHSSVYCKTDEWQIFQQPHNWKVAANLSLKDMKKIVKQFGHLLVFI